MFERFRNSEVVRANEGRRSRQDSHRRQQRKLEGSSHALVDAPRGKQPHTMQPTHTTAAAGRIAEVPATRPRRQWAGVQWEASAASVELWQTPAPRLSRREAVEKCDGKAGARRWRSNTSPGTAEGCCRQHHCSERVKCPLQRAGLAKRQAGNSKRSLNGAAGETPSAAPGGQEIGQRSLRNTHGTWHRHSM